VPVGSISRLPGNNTDPDRVIEVAGSPGRRVAVPAECTDVVLAADFDTGVEQLTDGRGVDVVIDPVDDQLR
jgi:NADPH2:quinone reductase